jgi:hypothetical protein
MEENRILTPFFKRKSNPIPRGVNYWLWFKARILENSHIRKQFEDTPLNTPKEFQKLVWETVNPMKSGPSFCRNRGKLNRHTYRTNIRDMLLVCWKYYLALLHSNSPIYVTSSSLATGLGIFVKHQLTNVYTSSSSSILFQHVLFGALFEINDETFLQLQQLHYPSLYYNTECGGAIMCGPLTLLNHQCPPLSQFAFTSVFTKHSIEEFINISMVYCKFICMPIMMINGISDNDDNDDEDDDDTTSDEEELILLCKQHTELFVDYFNGKGCSFQGCSRCHHSLK